LDQTTFKFFDLDQNTKKSMG